jgi:hypothetical protein
MHDLVGDTVAADAASANSIVNPLIFGSFSDQRSAYPQADPQRCIPLLEPMPEEADLGKALAEKMEATRPQTPWVC